jgi:hypothetical protein
MRRWSRLVVGAFVGAALVVLLAPDALLWAARTTRRILLDGIRNVGQPIPESVLLVIGMAVLFVVTFLLIFGAVRLFTSVGTASGSKIARWYERLTPNSPRTKGLAFMLLFTVVFMVGIAAFVPYLSASLTEDTNIDEVVSEIKDGRYSGQIPGLFQDDAVRRGSGDLAQKDPGVDTDGDGIPDTWEQAGETPSGASLPGADPDRMDLYVQLNYGSDVDPLDRDERRALRAVWSDMPVENPDGSTGIDVHLVYRGDRAGRLGESVPIHGSGTLDRYYTEERLGDRYCTYHQVTLGQIQDDESIGYAETPGYSSILDGSTFASYDGDVPFRVAMITHALLHNVAGEVDGGVHTEGTWLDYPDPAHERLSDSVADKIETDGFVTSSFDRQRCES